MTITTATLFSLNFVCGLVPCEPKMKPPEIPPVNFATNPYYNNSANLVVRTESGWVEGFRMRTTSGRNIATFQGIPYAEPPIGNLRFNAPVPKANWEGVRSARKLSSDCLQLSLPKFLRVVGNEDCLYLNIYIPDNSPEDSTKVFPVLVFLQGGSYYFGSSGDLGPAYLLNQDIILVTMNFRVGVLGFMSTHDKSSPGNYGLKDQSLALKWVFDNIDAFGGDPYRITIGGHGSGGASSHLHMMSDLSRDNFQSGVSLSGSALTHWAVKSRKESIRLTHQMAQHFGCQITDSRALVECLRNIDPNMLVAGQMTLLEWVPFPVTLFGPVVEDRGPGAFLTETPEEFYFRFESVKKPWVFGMTSQEGYLALMLMTPTMGLLRLKNNWEDLAPIMLDYKHTAGKSISKITTKLSDFYFGNNFNPYTIKDEQIAELFGDRMFLQGIHRAIKYHSVFSPTFAYIFDYKGKHNYANVLGLKTTDFGISHSEDLYYYFNSTQYNGFDRKDRESQLSEIMTNLISTFARTGVPYYTMKSGKVAQVWESVNSTNMRYLLFNNKHVGMIQEPFQRRIAFWEKLSIAEKNALHI